MELGFSVTFGFIFNFFLPPEKRSPTFTYAFASFIHFIFLLIIAGTLAKDDSFFVNFLAFFFTSEIELAQKGIDLVSYAAFEKNVLMSMGVLGVKSFFEFLDHFRNRTLNKSFSLSRLVKSHFVILLSFFFVEFLNLPIFIVIVYFLSKLNWRAIVPPRSNSNAKKQA